MTPRPFPARSARLLLLALAAALCLVAANCGGGAGSVAPSAGPAELQWDQALWDQALWG